MFYNQNTTILKKKYPSIYEKVKDVPVRNQYEVLYTPSGLPTIKIKDRGKGYFLHSKYDPIREGQLFAEENVDVEASGYILYGFGFAYHIQQILYGIKGKKIYVFEGNLSIFRAALENVELAPLLENPNIEIVLEDEIHPLALELGKKLSLENHQLILHLPSLKVIPENLTEIKYLLEEFKVKENTIKIGNSLYSNFESNIQNYDENIDVLFNQFQNIPLVLVSAGPSLDKNKHLLKEIKNKGIVLSVGRAVKSLIETGVDPDLIIMTDPNDIIYHQIEGLEIDIPLIGLSTCGAKVFKLYKGFKFLALQGDFFLAEKYAGDNQNQLVRTGGSVATTALDIAIRFGCNPIVFVGQDLAYTNDRTHTLGTNYQEITNREMLRAVEGVNGKEVFTTKNLSIYRRWIEGRIREENRRFINATEGGARIKGTIEIPLKEVIEKYFIKENPAIFSKIQEVIRKNGDSKSRNL